MSGTTKQPSADTFIGKSIIGEDAVVGVIGTSGAIIFRPFGGDIDDEDNQVVSIRPENLDALAAFVATAIETRNTAKSGAAQ